MNAKTNIWNLYANNKSLTLFWASLLFVVITDWIVNFGYDYAVWASQLIRLFALLLMFKCVISYRNEKSNIKYALQMPILSIILITFIYSIFEEDVFGGIYGFGRSIPYWGLGALAIYRFTKDSVMNDDYLVYFIPKIIYISLFCSLLYFNYSDDSVDDYNANAYLLLFLFPVTLYIYKINKVRKLLLLLVILGICMTMKRGAILGLVLSFVIYNFTLVLMQKSSARDLLTLLLIFAAIAGVLLVESERFQERFSQEQLTDPEKGASGRYALWDGLFTDWYTTDSISTFVFGHGSRGVSLSWRKQGMSDKMTVAHSDIIEYTYNYGSIGIFMLSLLYGRCALVLKMSYQKRDESLPYLAMLFVVIICVGVYSGAITEPGFILPLIFFIYFETEMKKRVTQII